MNYLLLDTTSISGATTTDASPNLRRVKDLTAQVIITASDSLDTASAILQGSNDGSNWSNIGNATNITANGNFFLQDDNVSYKFARVSFAIAGGSFSAKVYLSGQEVCV